MKAVIETARLSLRHFVEEDLDRMAELMANADFMRFSSGIFTREQTRSLLFDRVIGPARAGLPSLFAVVFRKENNLIGYCGFLRQVVDNTDEIEIGYRLHPDYWNQGLATEAAGAVRAYAFDELKLKRVISLIHPDNHASRRVTEKNGLTFEKQTLFKKSPVLFFSAHRSPKIGEGGRCSVIAVEGTRSQQKDRRLSPCIGFMHAGRSMATDKFICQRTIRFRA
ncbi:MAG: GNAT family N-acetyltransferase [Chthoniobacterales bacterium]